MIEWSFLGLVFCFGGKVLNLEILFIYRILVSHAYADVLTTLSAEFL